MAEYVIDTHPLIWYLSSNKKLSQRVYEILSDDQNHIYIPSIVIIEMEYLYNKKRIPVSGKALLQDISGINCWEITEYTSDMIKFTPFELSIHDAMISAYAILHKLPVITKDSMLVNNPDILTIW